MVHISLILSHVSYLKRMLLDMKLSEGFRTTELYSKMSFFENISLLHSSQSGDMLDMILERNILVSFTFFCLSYSLFLFVFSLYVCFLFNA